MRISVNCPECFTSRRDAGDDTSSLPKYLIPLAGDGVYVDKCEQGHDIVFLLGNAYHEILYESGIAAMFCGFNREALTSFAASLERFFEYAVRVMLLHQGVLLEELPEVWKDLPRSELQVGAFLALYAGTFKKRFRGAEGAAVIRKMTELRNDAVHKGRIPSRDETIEYAERVFLIVHETMKQIETLPGGWHMIVQQTGSPEMRASSIPSVKSRMDAAKPYSSGSFSMMLTRFNPNEDTSFEYRLRAAERRLPEWGLGQIIANKS